MNITKSTTIFDLTEDQKLIAEVLDYETTREAYAYVLPSSVPLDMLAFAEHTDNAALAKEIRKVFADELASFFNE